MRMRALWLVAISLALPLAAAAGGRQDLPVTVTPDADSHDLRWSDAGGVLTAEASWVLRSDLRGPATYLVVEPGAGEAAVCAEELRFRVLAAGRIEYRVAVRSDLAGTLRWSVEHGEGKPVGLRACIPRPVDDRRACLGGGVPRPLLAPLLGTMEARLRGGEEFVPVEVARFADAPAECVSPGG